MFENTNRNLLKSALKASEDLGKIVSVNIANANTLGYKALVGKIAPNCECLCFEDILKYSSKGAKPEIRLELERDTKEGKKVKINGEMQEGSNVNTTEELKKLVSASMMTKSILACISVNNTMEKEILNLSSS